MKPSRRDVASSRETWWQHPPDVVRQAALGTQADRGVLEVLFGRSTFKVGLRPQQVIPQAESGQCANHQNDREHTFHPCRVPLGFYPPAKPGEGGSHTVQAYAIFRRQGRVQQQKKHNGKREVREEQGPDDSRGGRLPKQDEPENRGDPARQNHEFGVRGKTSRGDGRRCVEDAEGQQQHSHVLKPEHGRGRRQVHSRQNHIRRKDRRDGKTEVEDDPQPNDSPKPLCACAHHCTSIF